MLYEKDKHTDYFVIVGSLDQTVLKYLVISFSAAYF